MRMWMVWFGLLVAGAGCLEPPEAPRDTGPSGGPGDTGASNETGDTGASNETGDTGESSSVDGDGDGYTSGEDCNDADADIYPGAEEICGDGVANDCDRSRGAALLDCVAPDLSAADAVFIGEQPEDAVGLSIAGAGDVNGDGFDDLLVGAYLHDVDVVGGVMEKAGEAYLVWGPLSGERLATEADVQFSGQSSGDGLGSGVAGVGDVNGDGFDDVLIGAPFMDGAGRYGTAYLFLGPVTAGASVYDAAAEMVSSAYAETGFSIARAGDMNGDGFDDMFVGSPAANSGRGAAHLIPGPVSGEVALADLDGAILGTLDDGQLGASLSSDGDVNGDGVNDLLVGAYLASIDSAGSGGAYYYDGPLQSAMNDIDADAVLSGESTGDNAGLSVAIPGDVNGDGFDDLVIGAYAESSFAESAGAAYVFLGPIAGSKNLAEADIKMTGMSEASYAGLSVAGAGDVDADGTADLLIGAPIDSTNGEYSGAAHLVLGPLTGAMNLSAADKTFFGEAAGMNTGIAVSGAGDLTGDGFDDVLIGASAQLAGGKYPGHVYLLAGGY